MKATKQTKGKMDKRAIIQELLVKRFHLVKTLIGKN